MGGGGLSFEKSYTGEATATSWGSLSIPLPNSGVTSSNRDNWCVSVYIQIKEEPSTSNHGGVILTGNFVGEPYHTLKYYCSSAVVRQWDYDKEYLKYSYLKDDITYNRYLFSVSLSDNLLSLSSNNYDDYMKNKTYLYVVNVYETPLYV